MNSETNDKLRREILQLLYKTYQEDRENRISFDQLVKQLNVTGQVLRFNLEHLERKGWVAQERTTRGVKIFSFYKITFEGIDLVENPPKDDPALQYLAGRVASISPNLITRIREVLLTCGPFSSPQELEAVFVDSRISAWRNSLPEATSREKRIEAVVAFLCTRVNNRDENAVVLLLHVLSERAEPSDDCHKRLSELADELEREIAERDRDLTVDL